MKEFIAALDLGIISLIKLRNINNREECIRFANRTIVKEDIMVS